MRLSTAALGALLLALAACQGEEKPPEAKTAEGKILPASISDAMLPLDTVRSQPPLAPIETPTGKPDESAASGDAASGEDEEDKPADAAPAAPPASAPSAAGEAAQ